MALPLSSPKIHPGPKFTPAPAPRSPRRLALVPDLDATSPAPPVRVSRPSKRMMVAMIITCLIGLWTLASSGATWASSMIGAEAVFDAEAVSQPGSDVTFYTVEPGDTLWSIAVQVDADKDVREIVEDLRQINGVDVVLQPGERLVLPYYANYG